MSKARYSRVKVSRSVEENCGGLRSARRVVIVGVPPVRSLDVFGPAEVFGDVNWLMGGEPAYEITVVSACRERMVTSYIDKPLQTDQSFREFRGAIDTLLVAGSVGEMRYEADFLDWLREQSGRARRFGSICTGALMLAKAGLLDGRRATTHWNWCEEMARDYPKVKVDPNPIYVRDGNCYTSAGVTAGIDLALALVEEDLGRRIALRVAQIMVVFLRRPAGQAQFSATLAAQSGENPSLGNLIAWLPENLTADLSVAKLARRHGIEEQARSFSAWSHVVALLYAQLSHALSLNDVCDGLRAWVTPLRALRGATPPARNTLSHANRTRDSA